MPTERETQVSLFLLLWIVRLFWIRRRIRKTDLLRSRSAPGLLSEYLFNTPGRIVRIFQIFRINFFLRSRKFVLTSLRQCGIICSGEPFLNCQNFQTISNFQTIQSCRNFQTIQNLPWGVKFSRELRLLPRSCEMAAALGSCKRSCAFINSFRGSCVSKFDKNFQVFRSCDWKFDRKNQIFKIKLKKLQKLDFKSQILWRASVGAAKLYTVYTAQSRILSLWKFEKSRKSLYNINVRWREGKETSQK